MLIALLIVFALLAFLSFTAWVQRKEIARLSTLVAELVEANNKLYRQKKNKDKQIKRLCHGNPELN